MEAWKDFIVSVNNSTLAQSQEKLSFLVKHFRLPESYTKDLYDNGSLILEAFKTGKTELVKTAIEKLNAVEKPAPQNIKVDLCFSIGSLFYGSSQLFSSKEETELQLLVYASDFFQKATTIDPKHLVSLSNLGEIFHVISNKIKDDNNKQMFYSSKSREILKYIEAIKKGEENVKLPPSSYTKYLKAQTEKEKATELFKKSDFKTAMFHYHCAKNYIKDLYGLPEDKEAELKQLNFVLLNNLALCNMKVENYTRAVTLLDEVLKAEPNNVKALFRRGKSLCQLKAYQPAQEDLDKALSITPNDKEIVNELAILKQKSATFRKTEAQAFSKIFDD